MVAFNTVFVSAIGFVAVATPVMAGPFVGLAASAVGGALASRDFDDISAPLWQRAIAQEVSPATNPAANGDGQGKGEGQGQGKGKGKGIFKECAKIMHAQTTPPKFEKKPELKQVTFFNVDPVCIKAIQTYVADPKNAAKKQNQGTAVVQGTTVVCKNLPDSIIDLLDGPGEGAGAGKGGKGQGQGGEGQQGKGHGQGGNGKGQN